MKVIIPFSLQSEEPKADSQEEKSSFENGHSFLILSRGESTMVNEFMMFHYL